MKDWYIFKWNRNALESIPHPSRNLLAQVSSQMDETRLRMMEYKIEFFSFLNAMQWYLNYERSLRLNDLGTSPNQFYTRQGMCCAKYHGKWMKRGWERVQMKLRNCGSEKDKFKEKKTFQYLPLSSCIISWISRCMITFLYNHFLIDWNFQNINLGGKRMTYS